MNHRLRFNITPLNSVIFHHSFSIWLNNILLCADVWTLKVLRFWHLVFVELTFLWYQEIDHVDLNKENIYLAGDKKHVFIIYFKSFFAHFSGGNVFISGSQYEKHCRPFLQNQAICFQKKLSNNCWQHFEANMFVSGIIWKCTIFFQLVIQWLTAASIWYFYWRYWTTSGLHWSSIESKECFFSRCSALVVR